MQCKHNDSEPDILYDLLKAIKAKQTANCALTKYPEELQRLPTLSDQTS